LNRSKPISRTYRSPVRAERAARTRRAIVEAARRLFATQGYLETSLAQIADEVGVSVQTIYNSIGGKGELLLALNDILPDVTGTNPLVQRIAESEDPEEIVALAARIRRRLIEGAGDVLALLSSARHLDPEVAQAYRDGTWRGRASTRLIVERLAALGALRDDLSVDRAADAIWALLHYEVWNRLVDDCGWTCDAAERWFTDVLRRNLLRAPRPRGRGRA
jgi:AcrR family transcriptional regulator